MLQQFPPTRKCEQAICLSQPAPPTPAPVSEAEFLARTMTACTRAAAQIVASLFLLTGMMGCDHGFPAPTVTTAARIAAEPLEIKYREGRGGLILIRGVATSSARGSAEMEFILDTGAPQTVLINSAATQSLKLDTTKARRLGPADRPTSPVGVIEPGFTLDFGVAKLSNLTAVVIDQSTLPCQDRFAAIGFQGIIGADLFRSFVVAIDTKTKTIRLHDPKAFVAQNMQALPLTFMAGHPHLSGEITNAQGLKTHLLLHVDSGRNFSASLLPNAGAGLVAPSDAKMRKSCFVSGDVRAD